MDILKFMKFLKSKFYIVIVHGKFRSELSFENSRQEIWSPSTHCYRATDSGTDFSEDSCIVILHCTLSIGLTSENFQKILRRQLYNNFI